MSFELADYDFELPPERIAQKAAEPRDSSRLMVLDRAGRRVEHRRFTDLPDFFDERDVLVANNTRVLKARLLGRRLRLEKDVWVPGGALEFVLLEELEPGVWEGLMHASARYERGLRFEIPTPDGKGLRGEVVRGVKESAHGTVVARFDRDPVASGAGELPLPHYIKSPGGEETSYQTVYASVPGSAAAPTAGLHFTPSVLERLEERGVGWEELTLNVGLGTFRPVKTSDIREHRMHEERFQISAGTAERVTAAKRAGQRITAVGTTSVRALESVWDPSVGLRAGPGRTSIFIYPGAGGREFQVVDRLLTNFHLPRSTLLMLVCAFAGDREFVLDAYREAVREGYRFFSYGDAMLVL